MKDLCKECKYKEEHCETMCPYELKVIKYQGYLTGLAEGEAKGKAEVYNCVVFDLEVAAGKTNSPQTDLELSTMAHKYRKLAAELRQEG